MAINPALASDGGDASLTLQAQLRLRELIVSGELAPGERLPELALVERLGVSRTPVRTALAKLLDEGLLLSLPGGGYAVKAITENEIHDAIEVRGTMEGLAARLAAERGVAPGPLRDMQQCLLAIDALLAEPSLSEARFGDYVELNARFHALLAEMSGSDVVRRHVERASALPFASPNGFVLVRSTGAKARDVLVVAQEQHRAVVEAIVRREGARAEAVMREHARIAQTNLREALSSRVALQRLPGGGVIRRSSRDAPFTLP